MDRQRNKIMNRLYRDPETNICNLSDIGWDIYSLKSPRRTHQIKEITPLRTIPLKSNPYSNFKKVSGFPRNSLRIIPKLILYHTNGKTFC